MGYCGIFYGAMFAAAGPYGATEWARALGTSIFTRKIIGEAAFDSVNSNAGLSPANKLAIMNGALKYLDPWARAGYTNSYNWSANGYGLGWDRGPQVAGDPDLILNGSTVHGYRMTDRHIYRWLGWVENAILSQELPCLGVFLDDFLGGRAHWDGADRPRAWGAMNGRVGYDASAANWNLPRMNILLAALHDLLVSLAARGIDRSVVCNSGHSTTYTGPTRYSNIPWMWEGYQRGMNRAELRIQLEAESRPGDILVVQGRHWDAGTETESWAILEAGNPEVEYGDRAVGLNYEVIWGEALADAAEFGLDIALGWHTETSEHEGSSYSCLTDPSTLE